MSGIPLSLQEWDRATPESHPALAGISFGADERARELARRLTSSATVRVSELAAGLAIGTTSFVGSLELGPVRLSITPKIDGGELLSLVRYAYRLRDLKLFPEHEVAVARNCFQDILLHQLAAEVAELVARGLHRQYVQREAALASPRGKVLFDRLATRGQSPDAALPCRTHDRRTDCLHNQVLLSGLRLGARLTSDVELSTRLRRVARLLEPSVSAIALEHQALRQLRRASNRLTRAYEPAIRLIEIVLQQQAPCIVGSRGPVPVAGFLFDMNRFFQEVLSRFLSESLIDYFVRDQFPLRGVFEYVPRFNPMRRRAPQPRPDFAVMTSRAGRVVAILDAKYRDLYSNPLPHDMLYQLAIYALSDAGVSESVILYPTTSDAASDARIRVSDPIRGSERAVVVLRPVHTPLLAELIEAPRTAENERRRCTYAHQLVFGAAQTSRRPSARRSPRLSFGFI